MSTLIIDADAHVTEPPDLWTSRVPRRYVDEVPRFVRADDGRDIWQLGGVRISTVGQMAVAGWAAFPPDAPATLEECHPAAYDAEARLRYMDEVGIWAQVLYPNVAGFGSQRFLRIPDRELQLLCVRAYNDFLHEWSSADPRRLITVCSTPFWDIEAAVAEVERCAAMGYRGILFTGEPQRFGLPLLGDRHWDPLWSVAQAAALPVHFHLASGEDSSTSQMPERTALVGHRGTNAYLATNMLMKNAGQCADLITCGLLPRFPELKFVSVESGIGWIPTVLEMTDYMVQQVGGGAEMLPSELFRRQVYSTFWFERAAPQHLLGDIPVDNVLFETDFPHGACLYGKGKITDTIDRALATITEESRRKIVWGNAARLYRVDSPVDVLAPA
jgi:predicted TIM-barrel fold metal-dependent hydrolase